MTATFDGLRRKGYLAAAAIATLAIGMASLLPGFASAAQVSTRSIEMSNSTADASGVTYHVSFAPVANLQSIVIDFCADSPIIGLSTCTTPTGLNVASAGVSSFTNSGGSGTLGTITTTGSTTYQLHVNGSAATTSVGTISFDVTGVHNPTAVGTFFARIYTYAGASNWTSFANPGSTVDTGGIALSTANNISITARVQEALTFCVSGTALNPSNDCTSASTASLTLGRGTPVTLGTNLDTASAYTQLSTNAANGAKVRMKSLNTCADGGLSSTGGTSCDIAGNGTTAAAIATGSAKFGLYVANSVNNTGGTGTVTPDATYHNASHVTIPSDLYFGMETGGTGVTSTYGSEIAASTGPCSQTNNQLVFGAAAALTTPAGVYTNNEILIATGTF